MQKDFFTMNLGVDQRCSDVFREARERQMLFCFSLSGEIYVGPIYKPN